MDFERIIAWMAPAIDRSYQPPAYDAGVARDVLPAAGRSQEVHEQLLQRWNGFYAMDGLLHVFGACEFPPNHSLRVWNLADGWRSAWGRLTEGLVFFAEDAFGEQFAYRAGKIVRFKALRGGIEAMQTTLPEWIEAVLLDPDYLLNRKLYTECVARLGALPPGGHFVPTGPFDAERGLDPGATQVMPARDSMEMKAAAALRIVRKSSSIRLPKG